jgi:hypothetical protein
VAFGVCAVFVWSQHQDERPPLRTSTGHPPSKKHWRLADRISTLSLFHGSGKTRFWSGSGGPVLRILTVTAAQ